MKLKFSKAVRLLHDSKEELMPDAPLEALVIICNFVIMSWIEIQLFELYLVCTLFVPC